MLAGALSEEDEDAVLAELEAITQVSRKLNLYKCRGCIFKHSLSCTCTDGLVGTTGSCHSTPKSFCGKADCELWENVFRQVKKCKSKPVWIGSQPAWWWWRYMMQLSKLLWCLMLKIATIGLISNVNHGNTCSTHVLNVILFKRNCPGNNCTFVIFCHHSTQTRHVAILHTWAQTEITVQMYL